MENATLVNLVVALIVVIVFLVMIFTGIISAQFILVLRHNRDYLRMAYEAANPQTQLLLRSGATAVKRGADTLEDLANLAQNITAEQAAASDPTLLAQPAASDVGQAIAGPGKFVIAEQSVGATEHG